MWYNNRLKQYMPHWLQLQADSSAYPLMSPQSNTIFLSYSQGTVDRLPLVLAHALNQVGYDVFMDKNYFDPFEKPPEQVVSEIKSRHYFLILITPATLRYGFNFSTKRLPTELQIAKDNNKEIILLLAYGKSRTDGWGWSMHNHFPTNPTMVDISIDDFRHSIEQLTNHLDGDTIIPNVELESPTSYKHSVLNAEFILDKALTEEYEAESDNRKSSTIEIINQALEIDSNFASAYFYRAYFSRWRIKSDEGWNNVIADYSRAIEFDSTKPHYYAERGYIYQKQQEYDKAFDDYTKAIEIAPYSYHFHSLRGSHYSQQGQPSLALQDFTKAIECNPTVEYLWSRRARVYLDMNQIEHAIEDYSHALAIKPHWQTYIIRGILYNNLGKAVESKHDWETGLNMSPKPESAFKFRARVHHARNESDKAISLLNQFIDDYGANERIVKLKNWIDKS